MFEKDAEDNKPPYAFCALDTKCELWKDGFQKGAEFGYNKAKVEVEDSYRESLCNSELNLASVTEQLEELEKANKWHKVAHGDLPSEEGGWVCNQNGLPCFFDWGTEQWRDCEGTHIRTTEWCHIPHKE